jgi:hypothetical protein
VNSRTINLCRVIVAACENRFIMQDSGRIIRSEEFIDQLKGGDAKRG